MASGKITEAELQRVRERIGVWVTARPWYRDATRDVFKNFARGFGDRNPLWQDEDYANKTRWKGLVAPPLFLLTYARGGGRWGGLPGVQALWAEDRWHWYQPLRIGDAIEARTTLDSQEEKRSTHAGRAIEQINRTVFINQRAEVVAEQFSVFKRFEKANTENAAGKKRYEQWARYKYSEAELKAIDEAYQREEVRGAQPRYWEDVKTGDALGPIVKGPLTATEEIAWYIGAGAPLAMASAIRADYMRRHPGINLADSETNVPDVPERIHWETAMARAFGAPDYFDVGGQRISWMAHLITNWQGDDGFLRKLAGQVRMFNCYSDTTWFTGTVRRVYEDGGEHLVDIDVQGINQRHQVTTTASAAVSLPSRTHGPVVLPKPMPDPSR